MRHKYEKLWNKVLFLLTVAALFCFLPEAAFAVDGSPETFTVQMDVNYDQTSARNMLALVNNFRTGSETYYWNSDNTEYVYVDGLGTLTYSKALEEAAMLRAAELILSYAHLRPNNTRMVEVLPDRPAGENIAYGYNAYTTYEAMFNGWKEDNEYYSGQGHRRNMLNPYFKSIGIAHVIYQNNYHFWVQILGTTQDDAGTAFNGIKTVNIEVSTSSISNTSNYAVSPSSISLAADASKDLPTVTAYLQFNSGRFTHNLPIPGTWTSANNSIAKIVDNKVTGVSAGSTTISTTIFNTNISVPVTVTGGTLTLTIDANKVLGYSNGISLTVDRDYNASGYGIAVYDVADNDKKINPTIDAPVNSGNTTTIKIHGSSLVNGKVYKLSVYKYNTSGSTTIKSNTVSVYGVPNTEVKQTTAQPINNGVKLNSKHIAGTSGIRYYIYDASTGKQVTKVTLEGESQSATISSLENGKLYYVYSRPYTMYKDKNRWGPQSNKVYFVPVASPSGSNVVFTDPTTAVISTSANSTATGIRVLYRVTGGSLKNGCEAASNSCSIGNLSNKTAYEFYLMRYKTLNGVKHYGSGITFQYTPLVLATLAAPQDAIVSYSGDTFTIKITKSGDADGISVLYRANEGNFVTGCEKASNSCTIDLDRSKSYTFYVMQYTTVDGKKTYSKGIVVKNVYGTKDASGLDIYSAVDEEISEEMISDALSVLDESIQEDVKMLLGNEAGYELIGMDAEESAMSESCALEDEMDNPNYEKDDNTPYNNADFIFVSTDGTSVVPIFMDTVQNNDDNDIPNIYLVPQGGEDEQFAPNFVNK